MVRNLILFLSVPTVRSLNDTPVIKDTYEGTRGSTHGERNDRRPARKAKGNEISFIETYF